MPALVAAVGRGGISGDDPLSHVVLRLFLLFLLGHSLQLGVEYSLPEARGTFIWWVELSLREFPPIGEGFIDFFVKSFVFSAQ